MHKLILSLLLLSVLSQVSAQELSAIMERHFKAAAQEKMQKVETIITTGNSIYTMTGFKSGFKIYQSRPDMIRMEGNYQGSKIIQTFNGQSAWKYAPAMGVPEPVELKGLEKLTLLNQVQFENPLWNYIAKGYDIEIIESNEEEAIHLQVTTADGELQHFRIDRKNMLISSILSTQILGGTETDIELVMEGYKSIKGIPVAHRVITLMNGQVVSTLEIGKVEINRKIDPALFEIPTTD